MSYKHISFEVVENVAHIGFGYQSDKKMTVLDEPTLKELDQIVEELENQQSSLKGAIFFSHIDGCFLAGADIKLISSLQTEGEAIEGAETGQKIFNRIEDLKVPTVACVNGVCLGGGLELALSCRSIICSDSKKTQLGLPEVKLGLLPGFGGTYRLPRRIGLPNSLDMILTGKTLIPRKAKKLGLVEEVYPKERLSVKAPEHFSSNRKKESLKESFEHLATDNFISRKIIFQKARESVLKKTKGFYQAPLKILDTMESGASRGRTSYLSLEAQSFGELCVSEQSQNLRHLFFLMEGAKKYQGPKSSGKLPDLKRGITLGAGTMGGGIAWLMADNNMMPIMKDLGVEGLELGLKQASSNFMGKVKRKRLSAEDFERKMRSISTTTGFHGFSRGDLVIEAIIEDMEIKKKAFAEVEKKVPEHCLLTSNTSSLSVEEMASVLERPQNFAGLHFFNPVHLMPLVEIITHSKISAETIEALYNWCLKVKKTPVIVGDGPGFLVNRILMPYLNEAGFLLSEGVSMKDIDDACLNFGMPMGPCRLLDEVGIDVAVKVAKILHDGLGDRAAASPISQKLVDAGLYGKKNSRGFYLYDEKGKEAGANEEAQKVLREVASGEKRMSETEIQMRLFLPMINEAAYILEDKIVERASDVDLGLIFGIGFPPFRGGLLRYADSEGVDKILGAIEKFKDEVSADRYCPAPLLKKLVSEKKKFYDCV